MRTTPPPTSTTRDLDAEARATVLAIGRAARAVIRGAAASARALLDLVGNATPETR